MCAGDRHLVGHYWLQPVICDMIRINVVTSSMNGFLESPLTSKELVSLPGGTLKSHFAFAALKTGLDHQTLENVDPTDSDKRVELGLYLLTQQRIGVEKTGANSNICRLDKREDHHFCGLPGNFSGG